ncbi:hypothetical protein HMPREF0063_10897 [Aeromicrobium marinum DSM 15272]|uniref:DUF3710 domain-containing protein n=1 Tax=Aeromicrobium marinum DSM 15272 TaxID=585531 RepID=E2SAA7_9ACTN|nr:DUF3710 domain-containing protein [Aeromicrobium marinum]EFQ84181.1 hypothetical protein HMPREF0063_10897 [Aeromicrobium marinum DSM 15272]
MALRRRKATDTETTTEEPVAPEVVPGPRAAGPWDASERAGDEAPGYVDLGALKVRVRMGLNIQMPTDGDAGTIGSVVLVTNDAGLELRAFAAPRSGGLWDEVRADLTAEVDRLEGEHEEVEGPFGTELRIRVPVTLPSGEAGFQPSRIVGVDGPRWMLRGTFLGSAALDPESDELLADALRDVIVVRGDEPRAVREALLLTLPSGAVRQEPGDDDTPRAT